MNLKWTEILFVLIALLLLFGPSRLPQLGQSLGSAIRNFKRSIGGASDDGIVPPSEVTAPAPDVKSHKA